MLFLCMDQIEEDLGIMYFRLCNFKQNSEFEEPLESHHIYVNQTRQNNLNPNIQVGSLQI